MASGSQQLQELTLGALLWLFRSLSEASVFALQSPEAAPRAWVTPWECQRDPWVLCPPCWGPMPLERPASSRHLRLPARSPAMALAPGERGESSAGGGCQGWRPLSSRETPAGTPRCWSLAPVMVTALSDGPRPGKDSGVGGSVAVDGLGQAERTADNSRQCCPCEAWVECFSLFPASFNWKVGIREGRREQLRDLHLLIALQAG